MRGLVQPNRQTGGVQNMVHLIGLNHDAQALATGGEMTRDQHVFAECLRETVEKVRPALIAEEDSEEALCIRGRASIAKEIAVELGIEHRFCDPSPAQRQAMGYRDGQALELDLFFNSDGLSSHEIGVRARAIEIACSFPIRERFWLEKLGDDRHETVVFVCGDLHVDSFGALLAGEGVPWQEVRRGIGRKAEDALYDVARRYLEIHPEIARS